MTSIVIPITGNDGKRTTAEFPTGAPTDLQITNLYNAVGDIILGVRVKSYLSEVIDKDAGSNNLPASGAAQRSAKWLCRYEDNTGKIHTLEIGTADHSLTTPPSDFLDLTAGVGLAFKTAFEAAVSVGGSPVTLISVQAVGRNL